MENLTFLLRVQMTLVSNWIAFNQEDVLMQIIHIVPLQCIHINIILKYGLLNCLKQSIVKCIFHDETLIFCPKVTLKLSQQLWSFFGMMIIIFGYVTAHICQGQIFNEHYWICRCCACYFGYHGNICRMVILIRLLQSYL